MARDVPGGIALIEDSTLTRPYGWVFFYNSKAYLETGDFLKLLVGNSPILVEASTGKLTDLGTALPVEESLRRFEQAHGLEPLE